MKNLFKHLNIVRTHRKYVRRACFKMGLYWQGLTHDLSKYSITELLISKYYVGTKSPHQIAREVIGYSPSWIHHYHTNKHHFQYWWDEDEEGKIIPMKMPYKYVIESFADMVGASKAYNQVNWTEGIVLSYWQSKCLGKRIMNEESVKLLDFLIVKLCELGEHTFYYWYALNKHSLCTDYLKGHAFGGYYEKTDAR